jgi:hypothetical protein
MNRRLGRISVLAFLVGQILLGQVSLAQVSLAQGPLKPTNSTAPPTYSGVDSSIAQYLCAPDNLSTGAVLYECISKVYRFGIAFGAIALVFFVVLAGYFYMVGGETGKEKGKSIFKSALTGMAIILSSYVLLNFINPDLVKIKPIQPPIFSAADLPKCEDVGFQSGCVLPNGQVHGGGVAGSAAEAQYKPLIAKYAQAKGLEYCALSALIQKESTFIYNNVSNPPPDRVNTSIGSPPSYNVTFSSGHGIGLTQVYIYPGNSSRPGGEFGFSKPLTVQDLINPETSISAGAHFFGTLVRERRNNLRQAYDDYQAGRGGNSDPATLDKYMDMYAACKRR